MASWRRASAWVRGLVFRDRFERELDDEMSFHVETQVEENVPRVRGLGVTTLAPEKEREARERVGAHVAV